jgi:diadenosine tetraphosphate (Ap4A) HIT family hydrolase
MSELSREQWASVAGDLRDAQAAVLRAFAPDHINIEYLGNTVPHMHWALIPRYRDDGRWGRPIWTTSRHEVEPCLLGEPEYAAAARRLTDALDTGDLMAGP